LATVSVHLSVIIHRIQQYLWSTRDVSGWCPSVQYSECCIIGACILYRPIHTFLLHNCVDNGLVSLILVTFNIIYHSTPDVEVLFMDRGVFVLSIPAARGGRVFPMVVFRPRVLKRRMWVETEHVLFKR